MKRPDHEDASTAALMSAPLAEQATTISALGMPAAGLQLVGRSRDEAGILSLGMAITGG